MQRFVLALGALVALAPSAYAAPPAPDDCSNQPTTVAIAECIGGQTKMWDQRLNRAYAALQPHIDPGQRAPLRQAQRLWIQFRDANCGFYGSAEGTIREIQGAQCLLDMTRSRAQELERAAQP